MSAQVDVLAVNPFLREDEMPHPEDEPGFVEFPAGEFPPSANVGPLA